MQTGAIKITMVGFIVDIMEITISLVIETGAFIIRDKIKS